MKPFYICRVGDVNLIVCFNEKRGSWFLRMHWPDPDPSAGIGSWSLVPSYADLLSMALVMIARRDPKMAGELGLERDGSVLRAPLLGKEDVTWERRYEDFITVGGLYPMHEEAFCKAVRALAVLERVNRSIRREGYEEPDGLIELGFQKH